MQGRKFWERKIGGSDLGTGTHHTAGPQSVSVSDDGSDKDRDGRTGGLTCLPDRRVGSRVSCVAHVGAVPSLRPQQAWKPQSERVMDLLGFLSPRVQVSAWWKKKLSKGHGVGVGGTREGGRKSRRKEEVGGEVDVPEPLVVRSGR